MSDVTFYTWQSKCGGTEISDGRKLRGLEAENARLDVSTLQDMLSKKLLTPKSPRLAVTWAVDERGYTQRRASKLAGLDRTYRYVSSALVTVMPGQTSQVGWALETEVTHRPRIVLIAPGTTIYS